MMGEGETPIALVTGASEGIGRAFSRRLALEGYRILGVARNRGRLEALLAELPGKGHEILPADLTDPADLERVAAAIGSRRVRLLVNNAGYGNLSPFVETPHSEWERMIALNVTALVRLSHAFLAQAREGDALIQVSSTLSFLPMPIQGVYSATKAFVTSFSESLWHDQRKRGVFVLNLCPGITESEFNARAGGNPSDRPAFLTQTADEVVANAMKSLRSRRGPTLVSGWKNLTLTFLPRILSRRRLSVLMGKARQ